MREPQIHPVKVFVDGQELEGVVNVDFSTYVEPLYTPPETADYATDTFGPEAHEVQTYSAVRITTAEPEPEPERHGVSADYAIYDEVHRYTDRGMAEADRRPGWTLRRARQMYGEQGLATLAESVRRAHARDDIGPAYTGRFHEEPVPPYTPRHRATPADFLAPEGGHDFVQDASELPARLCSECGMWPQHHNHNRGASTNGCCCTECDPRGENYYSSSWADETLPGYGDDSMHTYHYVEPESDESRSHP
jgi:hypothetical protein